MDIVSNGLLGMVKPSVHIQTERSTFLEVSIYNRTIPDFPLTGISQITLLRAGILFLLSKPLHNKLTFGLILVL